MSMDAVLAFAQGVIHSFTWMDLLLVVALVFLEAALSADNAVALAALVKHLPTPEQQNRALRWGIVGAYGFRIAIIFAAVWLVEYPPAQFVGACYLLWLAWQHFRGEEEGEEQDLTRHANFWQTLVMVEMTDLVFSFDSIAASVAVSRKPWVIILGGILGITLMRYMASLFLRWLDEFSRLEDAAFAIIALVGGCMLFEVFFPQIEIPEWGVMIAVIPLFAWGFSRRMGSPLEEEERQEGSVPSLSVLCTVGANELKQEEGISSFGAEPEATPELQPD
ncbi:TerC family protein [Thermostichus vulcanus]|uniref:TerC family protein n=1 Tax=Thermostichus vulcanus str. 'Rupite' TaxID=2813851 RepID=A0ABT0C6P6_THEVL|nr:TerC family protein [Thermostichus vulcanus]MCJ2541453.1 TerC family protein [Thermostichus vulcanus str. 'Rupite']